MRIAKRENAHPEFQTFVSKVYEIWVDRDTGIEYVLSHKNVLLEGLMKELSL